MNRSNFKEEDITINDDILKNLFDENQDAIIVVNLDFTILYYNKASEKEIFSRQPVPTGDNLLFQFPVISTFPAELNKLKNLQPVRFSFQIEEGFFEFSASPLTLSGVAHLIFIVRRRDIKNENVPAESIFKPLVQQSPIATAIFDPQGKPIYINKAYGALFSIDSSFNQHVFENYSLFKDEQLIESGVLPFIEKSLYGETIEIPTILYNPAKTSALKVAGVDLDKYVKGSIFPVKNNRKEVKEIVVILTDVTFQKQAEQILTEAHLKFQMLNLNLPGAIYEYERKPGKNKGRFIYMSQGCQEIFNIEPERIIQDDDILISLIHPDDLSAFHTSFAQAENSKTHFAWEGRVIVNEGIKWIEVKSSLRIQPDGRKISYGVLLDVTEKKTAEEQFRESEERLRLALQSADINLWEWENTTGKIYLNKNWAERFGFNEQEGKEYISWEKMVYPDDLSNVQQKFNKLLNGESEQFEVEYRVVCKDGSWSWILDKGRVVEKTAGGKVKKIVGTQVDINQRKLSEAIIKKNEQLFTQLFENAPLGIVLLDEKHRVVQMNKGFEDLFGFPRQEVIGNALNKIIVPNELIDEAHNINLLTGKGKVGKLESVRIKKDGQKVPVIIYGVPVMLNKKTLGIYGIYVDISERKKAERELQVRNDELDNFVYKVSHDLRAPLSSILGLVNLAHLEKNHDDPREYIDLIGHRVKQLDAFISDVLSHSKNLKLEVSVAEIDFEKIISSCFKELSYLKGAERIQHKIDIKGKTLYSDPWRMNEIFRNLISNAIKYMNNDQAYPYISINIHTTSQLTKIIFSDNGMGIDTLLQKRIFEMFYRATTFSEGSGIGLYIVKNAIEKLGGTIEVMSELEKGTTFEIEIPNKKQLLK